MEGFPKGRGFTKLLKFGGTPEVTHVGYNDFLYIAPQKAPWVQNHYTLHFVCRGSGFLEIGGRKHKIGFYDFFIIPPDVPMMYYPNRKDPWAYIWFCVRGVGAKSLFESIGADIASPVLHKKNGVSIAAILEGLFQNGKFSDDYRILSVFYEILHHIEKPQPRSQKTAKLLIDRNFQLKDFTVESLCRDCGLSHAQLCRDFLKLYGVSPKQYLISKRMNYAKELLESTDLTVDSVAGSCGYSDAVHFMKEFKRREGTTPGAFRKNALQPKNDSR